MIVSLGRPGAGNHNNIPSSINSELLILLNFLNVATLGFGRFFLVNNFITFVVSLPDILIIAMPETPGPVDKA